MLGFQKQVLILFPCWALGTPEKAGVMSPFAQSLPRFEQLLILIPVRSSGDPERPRVMLPICPFLAPEIAGVK